MEPRILEKQEKSHKEGCPHLPHQTVKKDPAAGNGAGEEKAHIRHGIKGGAGGKALKGHDEKEGGVEKQNGSGKLRQGTENSVRVGGAHLAADDD